MSDEAQVESLARVELLMSRPTGWRIIEDPDVRWFVPSGDWTVATVGRLDADLRAITRDMQAGQLGLDLGEIDDIDVTGAFLIDRTLRANDCAADPHLRVRGDNAGARRLLLLARQNREACPSPPTDLPGFEAVLNRLGRGAVGFVDETRGTLAFLGEAVVRTGQALVRPRSVRWASVVRVMEDAGLDALPIVIVLSFFIGMVIAFLGANILADFGAMVFTVDLVAISVMREFGVVLAGIVLAGRTASAFTAEIGSMKMRQEIDAMRVLGLEPMRALVVPRLIAMLLMTPLLAIVATVAGLVGGLMVTWLAAGISPVMFLERMNLYVPPQHFWVGVIKAPFFALLVALVGCRHGLLVEGDVASLGRRVTTAVVQSIFLVIIVDALFALLFLELGL
jgi:phospholipid/cholesterol/gamma-HCH transport system permease protein